MALKGMWDRHREHELCDSRLATLNSNLHSVVFDHRICKKLIAHLFDARLACVIHLQLNQLADPRLLNLAEPQLLERSRDGPPGRIQQLRLQSHVDAHDGHVQEFDTQPMGVRELYSRFQSGGLAPRLPIDLDAPVKQGAG